MNLERDVEATNTTLFRKPADEEDGRLMSQNNHLVRVLVPGSFIGQRGRGVENVKTIILQISPGMFSGREAGFSEAGHYV